MLPTQVAKYARQGDSAKSCLLDEMRELTRWHLVPNTKNHQLHDALVHCITLLQSVQMRCQASLSPGEALRMHWQYQCIQPARLHH